MRLTYKLFLLVLHLSIAIAFSGQFVAVLETMKEPQAKLDDAELRYLTDELRKQALQALPGFTVMTRENIQAMLPPGARIEECQGDCLVQTGKNIGADFVAQGRVGKFGGQLTLTVEMYETRQSRLVGSITSEQENAQGLLESVRSQSGELFAKAQGNLALTDNRHVQNMPVEVGTEVTVEFTDGPGVVQIDGKIVCGNKEKCTVELAYGLHQVSASRDGCLDSTFGITVPKDRNYYKVMLTRNKSKAGQGMVNIGAGCFDMGSRDGESDEKPLHQVCVSAFSMDQTEVTQEAYSSVMGANPSRFSHCGNNCPVEMVTWSEANSYCQKEGKRLPTEAEWEYAARAGSSTQWYCGDHESCLERIAWYDSDSKRQTHPVGQKQANAWGLYDMTGNVWEWTSDWYDSGYYGRSSRQDPQGPAAGSPRVFRGGGWASRYADLRLANRRGDGPGYRHDFLGFRCVSLE